MSRKIGRDGSRVKRHGREAFLAQSFCERDAREDVGRLGLAVGTPLVVQLAILQQVSPIRIENHMRSLGHRAPRSQYLANVSQRVYDRN